MDKILTGFKVQTRRVWKKRKAVPGSLHWAQTGFARSSRFARLRIKDVWRERLGKITYRSIWKEGYWTRTGFQKAWAGLNGDWDPDLEVWVVEFEVVKDGN